MKLLKFNRFLMPLGGSEMENKNQPFSTFVFSLVFVKQDIFIYASTSTNNQVKHMAESNAERMKKKKKRIYQILNERIKL